MLSQNWVQFGRDAEGKEHLTGSGLITHLSRCTHETGLTNLILRLEQDDCEFSKIANFESLQAALQFSDPRQFLPGESF